MDTKEDVKSRLDVVDFIKGYTELRKSGANFKALCPFHEEKTPSFVVSPSKQIWHCFGCGKGGDVFTFLMEKEGMDFGEALRFLADKTGVKLKFQSPKLQTKRVRLKEINSLSAKFFAKALAQSKEAKIACDYLTERKISREACDLFQIGYAPNSWTVLSDFLKQRGFNEEEIYEAGLSVRKNNGGYYDRFRGRLIFPIRNVQGEAVGFGARKLSEENKEQPKYINTQETEIYNKSFILYGLDFAKESIRKEDFSIIVEGYTDVIASHFAGVLNVVSSSGTALTHGQLELLSRHTKNIALAYDMDFAGDEATKRGIFLAVERGFNVSIISFTGGKDPKDIVDENPEIWKGAVKKRRPIMEYYFENTLKDLDLSKVGDKKKAAGILLPVIKKLADEVEKSHYIQQLASKLSVPDSTLWDSLKKTKVEKNYREYQVRDEEKGDVCKAVPSREERLIGLILKSPEDFEYLLDNFDEEYLKSAKIKSIYKSFKNYYNSVSKVDTDEFLSILKEEEADLNKTCDVLMLAIDSEFEDIDYEVISDEIKKTAKLIKHDFLRSKMSILSGKIGQNERDGKASQVEELTKEFNKVVADMADLEKE